MALKGVELEKFCINLLYEMQWKHSTYGIIIQLQRVSTQHPKRDHILESRTNQIIYEVIFWDQREILQLNQLDIRNSVPSNDFYMNW